LGSSHSVNTEGSSVGSSIGRNEDSVVLTDVQTKEGKRSDISSVSGINERNAWCRASGRDGGIVDTSVQEGVGIVGAAVPWSCLGIEDVSWIFSDKGECIEVLICH